MVPSLKDKSYSERLRALKLPSLEHRRLRGDMIETYKYLHRHYDVKKPKIELAKGRSLDLRGNSLKLEMHQLFGGRRHQARNNFFTRRISENWNSLPEEIVQAPSVNAFKNRLDKFWVDRQDKYDPSCFR